MRRLFLPEKSKGMADKPEMELGLASDCEWVRALDADGNSIRIRKSDLFNVIENVMHLGYKGTEGCVMISDNYKNGNLASLGQMYSSGSMYIGYGMKNEKGKYLSTTSENLPRKIFILGLEGLRLGSSPAQATPINQEIIGLTWRDL